MPSVEFAYRGPVATLADGIAAEVDVAVGVGTIVVDGLGVVFGFVDCAVGLADPDPIVD
jgi:hypothetical protein